MVSGKCSYSNMINKIKDIFGNPGEGIHSYRIFNIAYVDVIITLMGAYIIQKLFFKENKYLKVLFYLFLIWIILHRIFGIRTTIDKLLF